ncbi:hypothetical protein BKA70DRAFT_1343197 [Coprinopsis sp. MPI-PUGE-AT-0042]|nr:hypothetical protein BKA70DRAFT_1343197 [Coprinopsis sp. MPI-PUGE-AT-0042]
MLQWKQKRKVEKISFVGLETDIIILVMGATGVGKGTFVLNYTKDKLVSIGHGLESCTHDVACFQARMPVSFDALWPRRLILVDTPGFDDSQGNDFDILEKVSNWLAQAYKQDVHVAGIVYITDITQKRMNGTAKLNLSMFTKLCGPSSYKRITMVTSHWQELPSQTAGETREADLVKSYWADIMNGGAKRKRLETPDGDHEGSIIQDIILGLLEFEAEGKEKFPLLIQYELVEWQRSIPATEAGKELKSNLEKILEMQRKGTGNQADEKMKRELAAKVRKQIRKLEVPLGERIRDYWRSLGLGDQSHASLPL